jgi:hypothetical protein
MPPTTTTWKNVHTLPFLLKVSITCSFHKCSTGHMIDLENCHNTETVSSSSDVFRNNPTVGITTVLRCVLSEGGWLFLRALPTELVKHCEYPLSFTLYFMFLISLLKSFWSLPVNPTPLIKLQTTYHFVCCGWSDMKYKSLPAFVISVLFCGPQHMTKTPNKGRVFFNFRFHSESLIGLRLFKGQKLLPHIVKPHIFHQCSLALEQDCALLYPVLDPQWVP